MARMGERIGEKFTMKKKIFFLILSFITIYLILSYKGVIRIGYYLQRYKNYVKAEKIDKKLNEIVTPSELLDYYKQLKDLDEENVLFNRKNDVEVTGKLDLIEGDSGYFSEKNRIIFNLITHLEKLLLPDKQKMEKNDGEKVILMGKVGGRTKGGGVLNLYVEKIKLVNK